MMSRRWKNFFKKESELLPIHKSKIYGWSGQHSAISPQPIYKDLHVFCLKLISRVVGTVRANPKRPFFNELKIAKILNFRHFSSL
jgi:hypothetical protein